jgi:O-antigen/teichoic acid export membrane protein
LEPHPNPAELLSESSQPRGERTHSGASLLKNYSFLAVAYTSTRFIWFLGIIYMARTLGVQRFGDVNFAQAIVTYFTLLTHLGLMTIGTRSIARAPDSIKEHVRRILPIRLLLAAAAFTGLTLLTLAAPLSDDLRILTLLFGLSLFTGAAILDWAFKGIEWMKIVGLIEILRLAPFVLLVVLFVGRPDHVYRIPAFWFFGSAVAAIFGAALLLYRFGSLRFTIDWVYFRQVLREALPLGLAFILVQVYYLLDTVMLGFLRGTLVVGIYSAAYRMITFPQGLGGWYFETLFPSLSRLHQDQPERLQRLLDISLRLTLTAVIPLAVVGVYTASPVIGWFYGAQYRDAAQPLQVLIGAIGIELIGMNFGYTLMACNREKQYLLGVTAAAVTSVSLNLMLIPAYGPLGAAWARTGAECLLAATFFFQCRRVVPVELVKPILLPCLGGLLMVVCYQVMNSLIAGTVLGIASFSLLLLLTCSPKIEQFRSFLRGT